MDSHRAHSTTAATGPDDGRRETRPEHAATDLPGRDADAAGEETPAAAAPEQQPHRDLGPTLGEWVQAGTADEADSGDRPSVPSSIEETGLEPALVTDLVLKMLYRAGTRSGRALSRSLALPFHAILDEMLLGLQRRHLVEVRRTEGRGRESYVFDLTTEGRKRAREALSVNRYVGPAPVPFEDYVDWVERQSTRHRDAAPEDLRRALAHLVLPEGFIDSIGAAVNSGTSLFLYGPPGNGKTEVARAIADLPGDPIYVPHTVSVEGSAILRIYDPLFHHVVEEEHEVEDQEESLFRRPPPHDPRFVRVERPTVSVGGELTLDELDLRFDAEAGVYQAPPQLKANGGVFIIDDFGRQRVRARDLLNRWMVPLEDHLDYLSLPMGHKLPVPFDCFLVFATNLDPLDLVEEAFLRRLRYKVRAPDPTREHYEEIFRRCCEKTGLEYVNAAVDLVYREYYRDRDIPPRACHPRDLVAHILDEARYRGEDPVMDQDTMVRACETYFLDVSAAGRSRPAPGPAPEEV